MIVFAIVEGIVGIIVLLISFEYFTRGGKGNGFQYYAFVILVFNLIISLRR